MSWLYITPEQGAIIDSICEQFRTGFNTPTCLIHRSIDIVGGGVGHGLDANRVFGAQKDVTNLNLCGLSSLI